MTSPIDPAVVRAAARLFNDEPRLSNIEAMRRLVGVFGSDLAQSLPINRFERQVREPALRMLRSGGAPPEPDLPATPPATNGARAGPNGSPPSTSAVEGVSNGDGTGRVAAGTEKVETRPAGVSNATVRFVDDALLQAFRLGAEAESFAAVARGFRDLDALRNAVAGRLEK